MNLNSAIDCERKEVLKQWEHWLEPPMLVLGFVWLGLFIIELIWGLNPLFEWIDIIIWIAFIMDFGIQLASASNKSAYLKKNWLTTFSLMIPALRTLKIVPVMQAFMQSVYAVRGVKLPRVMTRINKGMRVLGASVRRRGFGYVLGLSAIVTLIGASGICAFERKLYGEIVNYGTALWWTAMVMTTIDSDFFPKTPEGRVLCFLLALCAFGVSGYVTATLATYFVNQDAEDDETELASAKSIHALQVEILALRTEIKGLSRLKPDTENKL